MKLSADDKRRSMRVSFKVPVEIYLPDETFIMQVEMINISVHGMLIKVNKVDEMPLKSSIPFFARIIIAGHRSRLVIDELQFRVVRIEKRLIGIQFTNPLEWFLVFTVYKNKQLDR